ncbi:hypothetical protein [Candidatus Entotheonella palauensis]|uniref:Type I restriction enzyme R protein N-terminal domain-containing protein n=1 Tax=Candidatus Entotheonella gemina TaxID=1429439 RepID=W4LG48_9BACT|nr:hypothetical protein [Candidatus Entotheonella palauensis]ETW96291.1 MAG: hypothetical protein ETSY2_46695 [Candidatus Entotheonella gemina]
MSYSDFKTLEQVLSAYPLQIQRLRFLPDTRVELPEWFLDNLDFSLRTQSESESEEFFCENFIYPFLHQAWKHHAEKLKLWSHRPLNVDERLFGVPDYFVAYWPDGVMDKLIYTPILAIAEAKRDDFISGWAQCLAEMIACQKLNADESLTVYGIVSSGIIWQFGKLERQVFTRDLRSCSVADNPHKVAGLLDHVFAACKSQLGTA